MLKNHDARNPHRQLQFAIPATRQIETTDRSRNALWLHISAQLDQQWYCFADDSADPGSVDTSVTYGHSEHADAANPSSWDRTNQNSNRGVKVTVQTGTRYDDAGDQTLYAYLRDLTFDADGHLVAVSAESKVTIDVTEDCA